VDDDEIMRESVRRVLEQEKWQVEGASNGRFALAHLAESCPDVIVLDLIMPEMDGSSSWSRCVSARNGHDIPVLVLTGRT